MYNNWLTIGPVTIHGYGVMIAIGILMAVWYSEKMAKKYGLRAEKIDGLAITAVLVGYFFSKVTYCLTVWDKFLTNPAAVLGSGGWVVYGGIIVGIFGAWLYCHFNRLKFMDYFSLVIPSVSLAQGFGRIGCFFAGCCYGKPTNGAWGVTFPTNSLCPLGVPVIPTQLLSSAGDFILFMILYRVYQDEKHRKETSAWYLILYSIGRFFIEFLRGDVERGYVGNLSTSQFIGLFVIAAGVILLLAVKRREKETIIQ